MTTIAYDRPVKDLISGLDSTGHVTHKSYQKTSVTLHHNGGRLSHEGVLRVWQTRPASAHFDVDRVGAVAQYVRVNEYAWAVGNTYGNQRTISIEMANSQVAPTWEINDCTYVSAARLAGWLFAKVIGERPTVGNLFQHKHWASTECAGPFIDKVWPDILLEAQLSFDHFKNIQSKPPVVSHPNTTMLKVGSKGEDVRRLQQWLRDVFPAYKDYVTVRHGNLLSVDGDFGPQTEAWVKEFQRRSSVLDRDGIVGPNTIRIMRNLGFKH